MPRAGAPRPRLRYPRPAAAGDVRPPNAGLDLVSAPEAMSPTSAQALSDYLVDRPGKLVPRGPLVGAALGGSVDTVGAIWNPATIFLSKKTSTVGRRLYPWETHLGLPGRSAVSEADLVRADPALRSVDLGSFVASDASVIDIGLVPGARSTQLGGLTYAIALDSAGELAGGDTALLANGTNLVRKTEILSFDLSGTALPTFPNPSFDTNTTGWAVTGAGVTLNRVTGAAQFDTAPAAAQVNVPAGIASTLTTTLSGTFKAGVTYRLSFKAAGGSGGNTTISATVGAIGSMAAAATSGGNIISNNFLSYSLTFTPPTDTVNPVFTITISTLGGTTQLLGFDTFTLTQTVTNKFGANAPMCAQDITAYLDRLFVLGGAAPGSSPASLAIKSSTLWWTDPGGPLTRVLAEWEDDVTGLVNQIQVGDQDPTDPGVALGRLPAALVIFKRRSLWALRGSAPSNFTDRRIALVGCLDPRSVVECHDSVYWLSEQGFMTYDGSTVTNLSRAIQPVLLAAADQAVGVGGVAGGSAVATVLPNDYILLSIGRRDTDTQLFLGLYHIPTGAWSTLSTSAQTGTVRTAFNANGAAYFADASTLWLANGITLPERNPVADKGVTVPDVSKDYIATVAGGVLTTASSVKIRPFWRSYMIPLSGALESSTLQRYLQDYIWLDPAQTDDDASTGWHVSLKNSLGVEIASFDLGTQGTASTKRRRRLRTGTFPEVPSDAFIEVSVPSGAPAWTLAELYTGIIEFEPAKPSLTE